MKIFLESIDSHHKIQIDILSNPPLCRWFYKSMELQKIHPITGILNLNDYRPHVLKDGNDINLYKQLLDEISNFKNLLEEKNITEFVFPVLPSAFNRDQHWCNDIHNIFVSVNFFLKDNYPDYWIESASWENSVFKSAIRLNVLIHDLEHYADTTENCRSAELYQHMYLQTHIDISHHKMNLWFEITPEEQALYHSTLENDTFYDVVFSNEILGKTFYRSFIDEEPSNSPAVSGIDKTWGNLDIKLDSQRTRIFKDAQFQTWLDSVVDNKLIAPLEFPVGSVNPNSDLDYFVKRKTTEVVFHFVD